MTSTLTAKKDNVAISWAAPRLHSHAFPRSWPQAFEDLEVTLRSILQRPKSMADFKKKDLKKDYGDTR